MLAELDQPEFTPEQLRQFDKLDFLIHKVFAQTEEGRELLELWKEALIFSPSAEQGNDLLTVGLNEGKKTFIRNILLTIKKVENDAS